MNNVGILLKSKLNDFKNKGLYNAKFRIPRWVAQHHRFEGSYT